MIVLDASVLIAHFDPADAHHAQAREVLLGVETEEIGASQITLAEVLVGPARAGRLALAERALERIGVIALSLGDHAPTALAELRAGTGLRMPDCCVLLAALDVSGSIATFDRRLRAAAGELGVPVV